jgi:hypothetical protein
VRFQVETALAVDFLKTPVKRAAAGAGERLAHHDVQQQVDKCGDEQDCERPQDVVIGPSDAAANEADYDECDAHALREILAGIEVAAGAYETAMDLLAFDCARWNGDLLVALRAIEGARFGRHGFASCAAAGWATIRNVHRKS